MCPCRWVQVFVLASCVVWAAGQEDSAKPRKVNVTKLVSAELHPNAEGSLITRCVVLTFPDVPRQPQTSSDAEQQSAEVNTTLSEPSPTTCPPSETPTQVYDSESSLLGALTGAPVDVSFIREQAGNYFVSYNRERRLSKAQVLEMVLVAMTAETEGIAGGLSFLKSQIQLGGVEEEEELKIVVVCLPKSSKGERVINDCLEDVTDGVGLEMSSVHLSQKGDARQNEKRESPEHKLTQTHLPPRQTPPTPGNPPTARSQPPEALPATKNDPQPPTAGQTPPLLQLSVSGIIRAVFPLSVSKMTAQLSLSLAPVAQTPFAFTSTPKPNTPKLPSFLKPPFRPSPDRTESSTSTTTPTAAETTETSSTAPAKTSPPITPSDPLRTVSSPPSPPADFTDDLSITTGSAVSPTASSELSTQSNTTSASSD